MPNLTRKSLIVVGASILVTAFAVNVKSLVRGDDKTGADDLSTRVAEGIAKMAADPQQSTKDMARIKVMEAMAKRIARDPQMKAAVADPSVVKMQADVLTMLTDPDQLKQLQAEVMADPVAMRMINESALMIATAKNSDIKGDGRANGETKDDPNSH